MASPYDALLEATKQPSPYDALLTVAQQPTLTSQIGDVALDRLKAAGQGALSSIPGVASARAFSNPDASGVDKASAVAGDIGGAAMLATPGGIARKLGLGAAINAGIEGSGIGPGARYLADKLTNIPAPETSSVPLNMLIRTPQNIAAALVELAPSLLMGKALGGEVNKPSAIPPYTAMLEKLGGKPLPSAYATNPITQTIGKGIERAARTNPITEGIVSPVDTANIEAIRGFAENKVPGSTEKSGFQGGQELQKIVENANEANQANYKAVLDQVKDVEIPKGMQKPGKVAAIKIRDLLNSEGFMPDEVTKLIQNTASDIERQGKTPGSYDEQIKKFNYENKKLLQDNPLNAGVLNHYFGQVNDILKQTHYDTLNQLKPGLGDILKSTNFDYAQSKGSLFGPFAEMAGGKVEELPRKMLTSGEEFRNTAKKNLSKQGYGALQDEAMAEMFRMAQDEKGNLNAKSLGTLYGKRFKNMDWRPDQRSAIESTIGMMQKAGLGSLSEENPSGTAGTASKIGHITAFPTAIGLAPLTHGASLIPPVAEALGSAAYIKAPQVARAIGKVANAPIPGTPVVPKAIKSAIPQIGLAGYLARSQPSLSQTMKDEYKRRSERR